jgi:hypothetical protein
MNSFVNLTPNRALKVAYLTGALIGDQQCWYMIHAKYSRDYTTSINLNKPFRLIIVSISQTLNKLIRLFLFSVENVGVEPTTSCLQSRRSSQLS